MTGRKSFIHIWPRAILWMGKKYFRKECWIRWTIVKSSSIIFNTYFKPLIKYCLLFTFQDHFYHSNIVIFDLHWQFNHQPDVHIEGGVPEVHTFVIVIGLLFRDEYQLNRSCVFTQIIFYPPLESIHFNYCCPHTLQEVGWREEFISAHGTLSSGLSYLLAILFRGV